MELKQLNVKNLNKLDSTLKEVFGMSFDFAAGNAKLSKAKTVTAWDKFNDLNLLLVGILTK